MAFAFTPRIYMPDRCFHVFKSNQGGEQIREAPLSEYLALGAKNAPPPPVPAPVSTETWVWDMSYRGASDAADGQFKKNDAVVVNGTDVVMLPPDGTASIYLKTIDYAPALDMQSGIVSVTVGTKPLPQQAVALVVVKP